MKSTERFSDRVENYTRYRPSYPNELIDYLIEYTGLTGASKIGDIGSGTGIFSKLLLDKGFEVFGVEPNDEMRNESIQLLSGYATYHAVNGTSEHTMLQSHAVDLLTAAQSFHWFDIDNTRVEFKRIMKPDGHVALIWNERSLEDAFQIGYEQILKDHVEEYNSINHRNVSEDMIQRFFSGSNVHKVSFDNSQSFDLSGLKGRLLSSSYAPIEGQGNYDIVMQKIDELFNLHQFVGVIKFSYVTNAYIGKL